MLSRIFVDADARFALSFSAAAYYALIFAFFFSSLPPCVTMMLFAMFHAIAAPAALPHA